VDMPPEVMTMLPVRQVADRYGASTAFMIQALARIGFQQLAPTLPRRLE